jgi:hypothetical protein
VQALVALCQNEVYGCPAHARPTQPLEHIVADAYRLVPLADRSKTRALGPSAAHRLLLRLRQTRTKQYLLGSWTASCTAVQLRRQVRNLTLSLLGHGTRGLTRRTCGRGLRHTLSLSLIHEERALCAALLLWRTE